MSLWKIAWRSIQQRGVASMLTTLSMALGVMLVVVVLSIHGVVSQSFKSNSRLGYNMIIGATKGGKLQLTLNTVYYLSQPIENVPYDFYCEFLPAEERVKELENSIAHLVHQSSWETTDAALFSTGLSGGLSSLGTLTVADALEVNDEGRTDRSREGKFKPYMPDASGGFVIPVCLGDYFSNFRVVGTIPEFFERLVYDVDNGLKYEFAQGRNFHRDDPDNGFFECVIGAAVARKEGVKIGDRIAASHGAPADSESDVMIHEKTFKVVGILKPTGSPNDRAVFVNMEGFYLMENHAEPIKRQDGAEMIKNEAVDATALVQQPLPLEQREVTAMLVRSPLTRAIFLQDTIDSGNVAQAVLPIAQITSLFDIIVRPIQWVLLLLTAMICIVSGVSILVSIYNSMSDRKHEIAVMRALGAGRGTVMTIILLEAFFLSMGGGVLGWMAGHTLNAAAGPFVEAETGVSIGFFSFAPPINIFETMGYDIASDALRYWTSLSPELLLVPSLMVLAVIFGIWPAMSAYRTDVAKSLGK